MDRAPASALAAGRPDFTKSLQRRAQDRFGTADTGLEAVFIFWGYSVRSRSIAVAVAVLAIGAAPAMAAKENALRNVKPSGTTVRPSAVWTPSPASGIKWSGGGSGVKWAVWIR